MSRKPSPGKRAKTAQARTSSRAAGARAEKPRVAAEKPRVAATKPVPGRRTPKARAWTDAEIEEAFRRFAAIEPHPKGELEHVNPYTLLVAVVLSAQATDAGVNKATRALFAAADTPEKMLALGEEKVRDLVKTIGLFNTKARNVIALSAKLVAEHGGAVPRERAVLEELPGVGRKTANVVLNIAFGEETFAVDTHVFRVSNRTGLAPGATPLEVEARLDAAVPRPYRRHAHHWLILHGRYVCTALRPRCATCPIADLCRFPEKPSLARESAATAPSS